MLSEIKQAVECLGEPMITLVSCDDRQPFVVEEEVALQSLTLKQVIEDRKIPLPVTSDILTKVVGFCKHQVAAADDDEGDFDTSFVQVDKETLSQLHQAADFLEIPRLRELTTKALDDMRKSVKQYKVACPFVDSKLEVVLELHKILGGFDPMMQQTIVFVRTWDDAMELHNALVSKLFQVGNTHAAPTQSIRDTIVNGFKNEETHVLITTDEHLEGFDFYEQHVNVVVNYDLPVKVVKHDDGSSVTDCEVYVQRVDRAGRFGKTTGAVFNLFFSEPFEEKMMKEIEDHFSAAQTIGQITEVGKTDFQFAFEEAGLLLSTFAEDSLE